MKSVRQMGTAYSTYGEEERCIRGLVEKPEGKNHMENPGRIKLKWISEKWDGGMDRDIRRAVVNAVMNIRVP
jgi:hypothetical protein